MTLDPNGSELREASLLCKKSLNRIRREKFFITKVYKPQMADCVGPNASSSLAKGNKKEEPKLIKFGRENGEGNYNCSPSI
jgi:hypothetical protein